MKFLGLIITAVLLGFGTNHVPMASNLHEDMCHGADCADMTSAVANDVACALHCLSSSLPAPTNAPISPLIVSFFVTVILASTLTITFKKNLNPLSADSPHNLFLRRLLLSSVIIRS